MAFAGGVFSRLFSWVNEAQAGNGISPAKFDQDMNDIANGLSLAILRDGTGKPTTDVGWNGKRLTNLGAPTADGDALALGLMTAAAVTRALGFTPPQQGTGPSQGANAVKIGWVAADNTLRAAVDATDLGKVWMGAQIGASDITGKLGYTPARSPVTAACSSGSLPDITYNAKQYVASVDFTATATSFFAVANANFQNNTSGSSGQAAILGCELYDIVAGSTLVASGETQVNCTYGQGFSAAIAHLISASLVVGKSYRLRAYAYKLSNTTQINMGNCFCNGICL